MYSTSSAACDLVPQHRFAGAAPNGEPATHVARVAIVHELRFAVGSGLIGHSQKMTVAAGAMAERKTVGQRS